MINMISYTNYFNKEKYYMLKYYMLAKLVNICCLKN